MLKKVHTKQRFATNKDIKKLYNKKKSCTIDSEGSYQRRGFFFFSKKSFEQWQSSTVGVDI